MDINLSLINPFISGAFSVLETVLGSKPTRGNPQFQGTASTLNQINVTCGVTGTISGNIIFGMSLITADKIASKMIGSPVKTFDMLAASAIAELANMICGAGLNELFKEGYSCDITPPTFIKGTRVEISTLQIPALIIPIEIAEGTVSVTVGIRAMNK